MSRAALQNVLRDVHWPVRAQVLDYVDRVADTLPTICDESGLHYTTQLRDEVVFLAGLQKLWTLLDMQYQTVKESLNVTGRSGAAGVLVSRTRYAAGTPAWEDLRRTRTGLMRLLQRLGVWEIVAKVTLRDLVFAVASDV